MKVQPTQNGDAAPARFADARVENGDSSAFKAALAQATAPGTDVAAEIPPSPRSARARR